jgi:hypothetical protein
MNLYKPLFFIGLMLLGVAFGQTIEQDAANRVGDILCPFVNILTGTVGRLIIIALLAVAVVMYFAIDSRAAKGLAVAAGIGAILLFNFGSIQQVFTGLTLNTAANPGTGPRVEGNTIFCTRPRQ